jgi:hypothetical protein
MWHSICTGLDWSSDGSVLAIINDKTGAPFGV